MPPPCRDAVSSPLTSLTSCSHLPHARVSQDEPLLLVMSDHIFDQRLLRQCCCTELGAGMATVLIDDSSNMIDWAKPGGVHCQAHCKEGHCGSLVKVLKRFLKKLKIRE